MPRNVEIKARIAGVEALTPVPDPDAMRTLLQEGEPAADGVREARRIMTALGIEPQQLLQGAYVDQLECTGPMSPAGPSAIAR